jgi:hypothetical protein
MWMGPVTKRALAEQIGEIAPGISVESYFDVASSVTP